VGFFSSIFDSDWLSHQRLRRYTTLVYEDLSATYSRDIQKWLLVAPIIGIVTGVVTSLVTVAILGLAWARILPLYLRHH
jgi:CIC family chloride channel protein